MDHDLKVLEEAFAITLSLDMQYRRANFNDKVKLKAIRDEAFNAFSLARLKLLEEGMICTEKDVADMKALRQKIESTASMPNLPLGNLLPLFGPAGGFVGLLQKFM